MFNPTVTHCSANQTHTGGTDMLSDDKLNELVKQALAIAGDYGPECVSPVLQYLIDHHDDCDTDRADAALDIACEKLAEAMGEPPDELLPPPMDWGTNEPVETTTAGYKWHRIVRAEAQKRLDEQDADAATSA